MKTKNIVIVALTILVAGSGSFYGGVKYDQSKSSTEKFSARGLQNLSPAERQQMSQQFRNSGNLQGGRGNVAGGQIGGAFLNGEIISKDEKSVTIKLRDGGSKIIFFSDSAKITKAVEGSLNDLEIGKTISARGKQNSDGSFTAETMQLITRLPDNAKYFF